MLEEIGDAGQKKKLLEFPLPESFKVLCQHRTLTQGGTKTKSLDKYLVKNKMDISPENIGKGFGSIIKSVSL